MAADLQPVAVGHNRSQPTHTGLAWAPWYRLGYGLNTMNIAVNYLNKVEHPAIVATTIICCLTRVAVVVCRVRVATAACRVVAVAVLVDDVIIGLVVMSLSPLLPPSLGLGPLHWQGPWWQSVARAAWGCVREVDRACDNDNIKFLNTTSPMQPRPDQAANRRRHHPTTGMSDHRLGRKGEVQGPQLDNGDIEAKTKATPNNDDDDSDTSHMTHNATHDRWPRTTTQMQQPQQ
ncbi:hypothetical protein EDB85DRAFT_1888661 [Lactarius pseudohatsudake]|nr:hypothetical protein EDB85DRAFT_1888661 [Lactarius pseudohatsudake]